MLIVDDSLGKHLTQGTTERESGKREVTLDILFQRSKSLFISIDGRTSLSSFNHFQLKLILFSNDDDGEEKSDF